MPMHKRQGLLLDGSIVVAAAAAAAVRIQYYPLEGMMVVWERDTQPTAVAGSARVAAVDIAAAVAEPAVAAAAAADIALVDVRVVANIDEVEAVQAEEVGVAVDRLVDIPALMMPLAPEQLLMPR